MHLGVDVGGTFTDLVAVDGSGELQVAKVRSAAGGVSDELWEAVDRMGVSGAGAAELLVHGTTVATNALIERSGGTVVLLTTAGFEDLLWLARQDRAHLYDLAQHHLPPVLDREHVVGVGERTSFEGVIQPLDDSEIERAVATVRELAPDSVAIALLYGFLHTEHEEALASAVRRRFPKTSVVASHEVLPVFREYERIATTTAEAFLRPRVEPYLKRFNERAEELGIGRVRVMTSSGGSLPALEATRHTAALALSGPAGGVEGARLTGELVGWKDLLTLDMGGTSTDVSVVIGGRPESESRGEVAGIPLALPRVLIETVGAGGGSIAWVDAGGALRVGPQSAGAEPGPACYDLGGTEPTVTDAALALDWLDVDRPLAAELALNPSLAREALGRVARQAGLARERCAEGILEVATATMTRALRRVSVERGIDPRSLALVAFGGAGPLFVCRLADQLGMKRAMVPPHPGVLSALGLVSAPQRREFSVPFHRRAAPEHEEELNHRYVELEERGRGELPGGETSRWADCRYPGQGYELTVRYGTDLRDLVENFHREHEARHGHSDRGREIEVVNARVIASHEGPQFRIRSESDEVPKRGAGAGLEELAPGSRLTGPLVIAGDDCTVRIEPDWAALVHESGALLLERAL